jgi:hypothetical protein
MSNANAISNVLGSFSGQLGLVNTGMGSKSADGTINISSTAQGMAATAQSQFALAGKSYGPVQFGIGVWGVINVAQDIYYSNYQSTGTFSITGAQAASLAGHTLNIGMGVVKSNPWGAAAAVGTTIVEFGFNLAKGPSKPSTTLTARSYAIPNPNIFAGAPLGPIGTPASGISSTARAAISALPATSALDQAKAQQAAHVKQTIANPAQAAKAAAQAEAARAAEINQQAQARLKRQEGVGGSSSSVSNADLSGANAFSDPIGSLNDSQGWTGSSSSGSTYSQNASDYDGLMPPIVIDLDGDGVELRPLNSSATFFDADSDSYQERTAWAGADDGILVIDLDGDGQVTQAKEIAFAAWTEEQDSDLQALATVFDSNQDGVFDSQDERFAEFRIWRDANSDGVAANKPRFHLIA